MGVKVDGAERVIQRLYAFDKEVWKVLQKEVREATDDIRRDAQQATPSRALSKWGPWNVTTGRSGQVGAVTLSTGTRDLGFSGSQVARSIKSQARSRVGRGGADRTIAGRVIIGDAAGAIFSLAGKKQRTSGSFGEHLNRKYGWGPSGSSTWPRLLSPAWSANKDAAVALIEAAVNKAAKEVTRG